MSDRTSPNSTHPGPAPVKEGAGAWLFRHRTALPLPIALAILAVPAGNPRGGTALPAAGLVLIVTGEAVRLWGVRHIGAVSRTRSERLGPLVDSGPFAWVRNPLYIGNVFLWVGFALAARLWWLAPIVFLLLALEYHAIVGWEERLLVERIGDVYRSYTDRVPRWLPRVRRATPSPSRAAAAAAFSWTETLFSERGTLIAIGLGYLLLWIKARF
ncbi:MAG TPA: isoprenylcysteine carboxylmethyltransferase family protein [Vicinamibacterales bacterium]|nr:isoprenylcysteine carboxylmethyltransferase family protein [Vicinamibacterales bacterium]